MMNQITSKQLYSRWDVLSDTLKEAIASETNSGIVWKTGEAEHLPKEKLSIVSRLAGYVLMGFIHPEDLARELHENLEIDIRIATSIADPINKKVFQPLREELEKIYSPALSGVDSTSSPQVEVSAAGEGEQAGSPQPVLMDSIVQPQAKEVIKPGTPGPPVPKFFQTGQIPKPAAPPAPTPKPATQSMPAVSLSNPPTVPATASPAAPFMLHTESKSQPLAPSKSGFKIGLSEEQFGKMEQKWAAPPRPAQIETGSTGSPQAGSALQPSSGQASSPQAGSPQASFVPKPGAPKTDVRVVHYSEMRTPVPQAPSYKDASRPAAPKPFPPSGAGMSVPKPHAPNKNVEVPAPPSPPKPAIAQAPPQKPSETAKPKNMLPGKPEEKELPPANL